MRSIGKNWSRGLTAATDSRVARNAARHRGMRYRVGNAPHPGDRRIRWARIQLPGVDVEWSPEWAYAIGLVATDGCLAGGKFVAFTSKDLDLVETFKRCVGAQAPTGRNGNAYRVQICDVRLFRWLMSLGLTPRKSLTLGALNVPRELIADTVRGLLDGDGSVITTLTIPNRKRYPGHVYQRLLVQFLSGGARHIDWLRATLNEELGLQGWVQTRRREATTREYAPLYLLRYSKHEAMRLLQWLYASESAPRLARKYAKWIDFRDNGLPTRGWHRSAA